MPELNLSRQSRLVPKDELTNWNFEIFGVGSVGSHVVNCLAKTGFKNITVYDMDKVDEENIGPQAYMFKHMGMPKVEAIKDLILEATGHEIIAKDGEIKDDFVLPVTANTMYLCFFDSFEARNLIFNKALEMPVGVFVDGRIGQFNQQYYLIDISKEDNVALYKSHLPKSGGSELICGEKASCMINYELAGRIVSNIVNYISGKTYDKLFIGNVEDNSLNMHIRQQAETKVEAPSDFNPEDILVDPEEDTGEYEDEDDDTDNDDS